MLVSRVFDFWSDAPDVDLQHADQLIGSCPSLSCSLPAPLAPRVAARRLGKRASPRAWGALAAFALMVKSKPELS